MPLALRRQLQYVERRIASTKKEIEELKQRALEQPRLFGDPATALEALQHYREYLEKVAKDIQLSLIVSQKSKLVQGSFKKVLARKTAASEIFYDRLFTLDPNLRPLFKEDMREQRKALMSMLEMIVAGLNKFEDVVPAMEALGARHVNYKVRPEHYRTFGAALLQMLEQLLGDDFTEETRAAWVETYNVLSAAMVKLPGSSGESPS
jgi:hemoglobin-like flavoprotein